MRQVLVPQFGSLAQSVQGIQNSNNFTGYIRHERDVRQTKVPIGISITEPVVQEGTFYIEVLEFLAHGGRNGEENPAELNARNQSVQFTIV